VYVVAKGGEARAEEGAAWGEGDRAWGEGGRNSSFSEESTTS
jgi:hypothetical protein